MEGYGCWRLSSGHNPTLIYSDVYKIADLPSTVVLSQAWNMHRFALQGQGEEASQAVEHINLPLQENESLLAQH